MMKAKLRGLISADIDERVYWPDDESNFYFAVQAFVGVEDDDFEEVFYFQVCTPTWISTKMFNYDFGISGVFGNNLIIIKEYNWDLIKNMISDLCSNTTGDDWSDIAIKLSRFGHWEGADPWC